ncbi:MAG TPA: extracellular solute-binding protein [Gemmatimonadaceae bacterium]
MNRLLPNRSLSLVPALFVALAIGCGGQNRAAESAIVVFNAGALALPLRQALDSFARQGTLQVSQENAGSVETVRKILDLHRIPDVLGLADTALFSRFLGGRISGGVTVLGSTRMVLAYTPRSRFAAEVSAQNWADVTTRPGVQVGRSDPSLDPAGYRALMAMQLAEKYYGHRGLASRLERAAPAANMRPKSADLIALLQTGNLDYAWEYESVARRLGLRFVALPPEVDLGDPALAGIYATAKVEIPDPGSSADGVTRDPRPVPQLMIGAPIVFGAAVPTDASHPETGRRFITYLMSQEGRAIFASYGLVAKLPVSGAPRSKHGGQGR